MKEKYTETALHTSIALVKKAINHHQITLTVILDIEGAFNKVSTDAIQEALEHVGTSSTVSQWINNKTGKVEQINASDIELVNFQRFVGTWGIRIFTTNGTLHRFSGFKDSETEKDKVAKLCLKGWNWGTAKFNGSVLSLDVDSKTTFEIPLNNVSQCNTGKNEVTLEFHHNDDAAVNLMEMRFHIPITETTEDDPVESFYNNVIDKASVLSASGEEIAIFKEVYCLTPRGRYDIKIFQTFFQLHGKTFDYKIPMSTVLRLFLLPHKDGRQMFFVLSLDPPIKQGQTRYHFLELSGPVYEVMGKIMKVLINRKITGPGNFIGHSGAPAVSCSFKAAAGYIYPLERGF
uniref:FACT complex subunit SSRP1 n=1 Tax=Megaselia scalaris TaxID=36166 RepID=T1GQA6_MEGSC